MVIILLFNVLLSLIMLFVCGLNVWLKMFCNSLLIIREMVIICLLEIIMVGLIFIIILMGCVFWKRCLKLYIIVFNVCCKVMLFLICFDSNLWVAVIVIIWLIFLWRIFFVLGFCVCCFWICNKEIIDCKLFLIWWWILWIVIDLEIIFVFFFLNFVLFWIIIISCFFDVNYIFWILK